MSPGTGAGRRRERRETGALCARGQYECGGSRHMWADGRAEGLGDKQTARDWRRGEGQKGRRLTSRVVLGRGRGREGLGGGGRGRGRAGRLGVERRDEGMLGSARGGWAVSRALGGLYGGRVSCHGSIMYGTRSRVPSQRERERAADGESGSIVGVPLCRFAGWSSGQVSSRSPRRVGLSVVRST